MCTNPMTMCFKIISSENTRLLQVVKQLADPLTREAIEEKGFAAKVKVSEFVPNCLVLFETTHFLITIAQSEGLLK